MVLGIFKNFEKINFGPYDTNLLQEWSLVGKFGKVTCLVPGVSSLADLVPGSVILENFICGPHIIHIWQNYTTWDTLEEFQISSLKNP